MGGGGGGVGGGGVGAGGFQQFMQMISLISMLCKFGSYYLEYIRKLISNGVSWNLSLSC